MATSWTLTVSLGKTRAVVDWDATSPQWLARLKEEIESQLGVQPKHQKLLFRGREVDANTKLVDQAKVMLMFNQQYHRDGKPPVKSAGSNTAASALSSSADAASPDADAPASASAEVASAQGAPPVDVDALEHHEVLVQLVRGKRRYELIFALEDSVLVVKQRMGGIMGLAPSALRFIVKGKATRDDSVALRSLLPPSAPSARVIKAMLLLQEQAHVDMEKEDDLRLLLNELTQCQGDATRVKKQMARNFTSRDESLLQLTTLLDRAQHLHGNLLLLKDHFAARAKHGASAGTRDAIDHAATQAETLVQTAETLLAQHSTQ